MPGSRVSSALILAASSTPISFFCVEILLAPNHLHRGFESGQLRFEVVLVPRKVRVVVGEGVRRRRGALVPSAGHVVLEFPGNLELSLFGQTSSEAILKDILAILVQLGAPGPPKAPCLQALLALVHVTGSVERGEVANDDRPRNVRFFQGKEKGRQGSDIGCVNRQRRGVDACLPNTFIQNMRVVSVVNCGSAFSRASHLRQSYSAIQ